jgi:hypothetical protein
MKFGAVSPLNAVIRPRSTKAGEMLCCRQVPIAGFYHNIVFIQKLPNQSVQRWNNFIATCYGKRAARAEVILNIDDYQGPFLLIHGLGKLLDSHANDRAAVLLDARWDNELVLQKGGMRDKSRFISSSSLDARRQSGNPEQPLD